jgi:hypothetical protein
VEETKAKRDYKDEYKKFQSSTKSKKYRAELNKYNRKKGTYGNGDGKDASHKGGKIVGFESQSKNRGRAEKSRLKQESLIYEIPSSVFSAAAAVKIKNKDGKEVSAATAAKSDYAKKDPSTHKKAKSIFQRLKDKFSKKKDDKPKPKKQSKGDADFYKRQYAGESVNEGQKREASNILNKFDQAYLKFSREVRDVIKMMDRSTGDKTAGKIIDKAYSKGLIPLDKLMQSWGRGQQNNPHIKESVNEVKSKTMKTIGSIIGKKQAQKISGVLVDMQTALVIMKVWNALGSSNRAKFEKLPIKQMATVAWKLMK